MSSRGYQEALDKLSSLRSNKATTQLFEKPKHAQKSSSSGKQDLNAAALPEMLQWLHRAGYSPSDLTRMRHIHVAGTKGKGSVCAYATSILRQYKTVGTYTSPHLVSPRERIAINGEAISQEVFCKAFFEIWDRFTEAAVRDGMDGVRAAGPESKPFLFRFLTILAWHIFLEQGIKDVVIECGIGGEYDATNVLPPRAVSAAVIAQLGIDHVAMLGDTVEKIAWHKAGILKPGVKGFTLNLASQPSVMDVLRCRATEKGAQLTELSTDDINRWGGVSGILRGDFQKNNQALALAAVREHLGMASEPTAVLDNLPDKMVLGLQKARLRGRCEVIRQDGTEWLIDGAHTKDSLDEVAKWLAQSIRPDEKVILVFNQQDRDANVLLEGLVGAVKRETRRENTFVHALFTRNEDTKHLYQVSGDVDMSVQEGAATSMKALAPDCQTAVFDNLHDAIAQVRRLAADEKLVGGETKVLVTGSLYLVGGILRALEPDSLL